ncbi:APOBEC1 complementation factor-like isoform X2 [Crassostrea virginica]|uniref:APOBEC1 complementation factor-like isoform X2 n=1 Tax=Crassostrea virginica TaxID=6565 RepID=A0A8B8EA23_CRAVI|nr:APOBEC1 complementation factor-like isoform X2 [Crassostrea virginica]XP_022336433.1 APOBEC1 complementation factor-like isoform X2 [Crassostrea virginica]
MTVPGHTTNMEEKQQSVSGTPNEANLLKLMERTGYPMVQENGQRKYGPPPDWNKQTPPRGCEIFVGKIPRDCYEDELVPVFERVGKLYELRLMMDFSGSNRGYAFVMYTNRADAQKAVRELNNFEIRKGRLLGVCTSVDNCRLFVGGIPKTKNREEILQEMKKVTEGVVDVIVYPSAVDKSKNRGFAFVEYESHRAAAMARRKLIPGRIQLWSHQIAVDWAEPEQDVDPDTMSKVKILYVRNLMLSTTEETIQKFMNSQLGKENAVERVKKIKDYAFVHFKDRDDALQAMDLTNNSTLDGARVEVVLAKPVDKNDYRNYTRGKSALQQAFTGYSLYGDQTMLNQIFPQSGREFQGRTAVGIRGALRGRGRGAAGSRGAGNQRTTFVPGLMGRGLRRYPQEDRLYDLLPGMELTPTNPVTLKPQSVKPPPQILDDFCQKNGLGSPMYQLHSTVNGEAQLFLYKVTIPAYPNQFQPNKLCRTVDDAKCYAAEFVMSQLGIPMDGPPEMPTGPVVASAPVPPNPYQGRPIGPAYASIPSGVSARPDLTFASTMPVVTSAPPSYVMAPGEPLYINDNLH